ncbi:MAG: helix-turn-helix transcriptional regulator [Sphingomonadales bacterium]
MPHIKNALIRYRIIDRMLRNKYKPYPSKEALRSACEEALFGSEDGAHICASTIEKDLFTMKMEHDAPIRYSKKHGGYCYEDPDFSINDVPLSEDELSSIRFAVSTLQQFREVPFFQQFGLAIDKIVDRVAVGDQAQELADYIQFEAAVSTGGNEYLPTLLEGIQAKKRVWFLYTSFQQQQAKPRKVSPLFLKEYRNRWYLISYDTQKQDIVTFALDRMSELQILDETAQIPSDFNAKNYFKNAVGITTFKGEPQRIVLKAEPVAARYIETQPFHTSQLCLEKNANYSLFELRILVTEEFIRNLLGYAGELEVLEPKSLRLTLKERGQALLNRYQS